jgi:hypothetical protein
MQGLPPFTSLFTVNSGPAGGVENAGGPVADVRKGCWLSDASMATYHRARSPVTATLSGDWLRRSHFPPGSRFNRTSDINALGELPSTIEITSTWNGSYLNATDCLSFSSFYRYLHTCRRHLRQGLLVAFLASGGGHVPTPTPPSGYEGMLLKQRVVGLVGAECGWECSPITLVAVTTSYLVHG